jgi:dTDP-glucose 4,6-dehydratase
MVNAPSRFANRYVFSTGVDGFIGSHPTERLVEFGANVHVFVRATSSGELRGIPRRPTPHTASRKRRY